MAATRRERISPARRLVRLTVTAFAAVFVVFVLVIAVLFVIRTANAL